MNEVLVLDGSLELAISAWLDAKGKRSGSIRTATDYAKTLQSYRSACQSAGYNLDSDKHVLSIVAQAWAGSSSRGREVTANTYNLRLAIVSSFYAYAVKHSMLPDNPINLVERRVIQAYAAAQPLDKKQVSALLKRIDRSTIVGMRDHALLKVGLTTGRRVAELAALRMGGVQVADGVVTLNWERSKGGKVLRDKLSASVGNELLDYLHALYGSDLSVVPDDAPVWVSNARNRNKGRGGPLGTQGIADVCARWLHISKTHVLRHTFAWNMEDAGAKLSEIQHHLAHSNAATTSRYLEAMHTGENPYSETLARWFEE